MSHTKDFIAPQEQRPIKIGFGLKLGLIFGTTVTIITILLILFFYYRAKSALYYQLKVKLENMASLISASLDKEVVKRISEKMKSYPQKIQKKEIIIFVTDSEGKEYLDEDGNRQKKIEHQKVFSYSLSETDLQDIQKDPDYIKIQNRLTTFRNSLYNLDLLDGVVSKLSQDDRGGVRKKVQKEVKNNPNKYKLFRFAYLFIPNDASVSPINIDGVEKKFVTFLVDCKYDSEDDASLPGDPFEITEKPFFHKTFASKLASAANEPLKDEWGIYMQALAPILDSNGNLIAAVGIDVTVETVEAELSLLRKWGMILTIFMIILSVVSASVLARWFSNPINKLNRVVSKFANKDFGVRVRFKKQSKWHYDQIGRLADNFNYMAETIQNYSENLELMVKERTEALNKSLEDVQALTIQQHGDYYLTSRLIIPLCPNNNHNPNLPTKFYLKQKKQFEFRNRKADLGGDICATDTIELQGKSYTVFMNGDAMGKSMQGAGGSIVLGVVFNSILSRTHAGEMEMDPITWMKKTFRELESVFLSFDGSMMISAVIGLLDEDGNLYYINAEHPFTVLYRNGVASFIEDQIELRKFGSNYVFDADIKTYKLENGDTLFCGSDGRDDIEIETDEDTGVRKINENEYLFLKHVSASGGDLEILAKKIESMGTPIDDISLLKVEYHTPNEIEENKENIDHTKFVKEIQNHIKQKNLNELQTAYKTGIKIWNSSPKPEIYKVVGQAAYLLKDYFIAAYSLERAFYFQPSYKNLLYGIAISYFKIKDLVRAYYYVNLSIEQNNDDSRSRTLLKKIQEIKGEDITDLQII